MFQGINLADYIQESIETAANTLMDAEACGVVNAAHYERSGTRTAYRNGYRVRRWQTHNGPVTLHIPKLRSGSYYPAFLEQAEDAEHLLTELAMRALMQRIQPDDLTPLLTTANDIQTAEQVALTLNQTADAYLSRRLRHPYPTLIVEATPDHIIVMGERGSGTRHLLDVRERTGDTAFWSALLRDLMQRGLEGVEKITGSGVEPALRRTLRALLPEAHHTPDMIIALGTMLTYQPIDRRQPLALLTVTFDSTLEIVVSTEGLNQIKRLLQYQQDAIGLPLEQVAA